MKRKQFKIWLLFLAVGAIFAACEGPQGIAGLNGTDGANGTNGVDGTDGNATCMACHSGETKSNIEAQFSMSVHSSGVNAVDYAGGRASCAACHSHQGFVQFANNGEVLGNITNPTAWECATCHGLHETMEATDYALRLKDPVKPIFDPTTTMDLKGNSNLCANCHQSRRAEPNIDKPGDTYNITSTHYGPHHGAQANVVAGVGFAQIAGSVDYPEAGSAKHLNQASCTGCHMAEFDAEEGEGGHSWKPSLLACNTCHDASNTDFNYGGVRTDVEDKLIELRDQLITLGVVGGDDVDGYHPVVGTYPMKQAQAFFNWVGLEEDRSFGAHNPKYVKALLQNSIEAMEVEIAALP
ncbi:hypothetical protein DWB61_02110 [Ancylomarina euxinus]|uniref:Uncharacterized protein n=1 Tax=Ancylomarina euxinus TaxID=2283627 RepID=A0A425Y8C0_9BACT|nr:hypothetical protein [Ancylomarina euxinus]MCZ4693298.1 hypothetical protein [Ancylomarina euxinus]MUP13525.1 hypothetical protein [Ancylomarina euxinus]RRG24825.1 hypothetical protein DWB61_02110 [Ancylomarina euxinus]